MPQAACKALVPRPMPSRHMSVSRSGAHGSIRERHCGRRQAPASTAAHVRCNGAFDPAETSDRLAQTYASNRLAQIPCNKGGWLWQGAVPLGMGTVPLQLPPAGMSARGHQPAETSGRFSADPRIQPAHSNSPHRGGPASATGHGVASRRRRDTTASWMPARYSRAGRPDGSPAWGRTVRPEGRRLRPGS